MGAIDQISGINPNTNEKLNIQSPAKIAEIYHNIIAKFKLRGDVQNGRALAYKGWNATEATIENTPKGIGDGMSTTGWCVSASSALLNDPIFQETIAYRHATAKLISIDIKEQWYGKCYNGSFNKWHTAILVNDGGFNLIVDITCSQFSGDFNEKYVWDFKTWETTFRSAYCKHDIFDASNNVLSPSPTSNFLPKKTVNVGTEFAKTFDALHSLTNMNSEDKRFLAEYFTYNINVLNDKMLRGDISQFDFEYITKLTGIFAHLPYTTLKNGVCILKFKSKDLLKGWLKLFLSEECTLPTTIFVSDTIEKAASQSGVDMIDFNQIGNVSAYYIHISFESIFGVNVDMFQDKNVLLGMGVKLNVDLNSIRNGGKDINDSNPNGIPKETNTVFLTVNV